MNVLIPFQSIYKESVDSQIWKRKKRQEVSNGKQVKKKKKKY